MGDRDVIGKQLIRHLAVDIAIYLLGLDLDPDSLELLETEQQRVESRQADLIARVRERGGALEFILHIEIQNNNDTPMPWRMLRYRTDIGLVWPALEVRQFLIYIGRERLRMPAGLDREGLAYHYHLLDMRSVDCQRLMAQDNPDALVLAVLCDFGQRDARAVIGEILDRLQALVGDNPRRFREYLGMLEILSENRELRQQIKEAEKMLSQVKLENLPSYELGMEKGMEKGVEKGMERGGHARACFVARNLLDVLDDETIAAKTQLPVETVRELRAQSLRDAHEPTGT